MITYRVSGLVAAIICALVAHCQQAEWVRVFGAASWHIGANLVGDSEGSLYGTGTFGGQGGDMEGHPVSILGNQDIYVVKWDTAGHVVWVRTAGGICALTDEDYGGGIVFDENNQHILLSGQFDCPFTYFGTQTIEGSTGDGIDRYVACYDTAGNCLWVKGIRAYGFSGGGLLVDDASSVFYISGAHMSNAFFQEDPVVSVSEGCFIAKYSANGTFISAERFMTSGDVTSVAWVADDEWVIGGYVTDDAEFFGQSISASAPGDDGYVARTDTAGNVAWITSFGSDSTAAIIRCTVGINGKIGIAGYFINTLFLPNDTLSGVDGERTYFIGSLDTSGNVEWVLPTPTSESMLMGDLEIGENGDLYMHGFIEGSIDLGVTALTASSARDSFIARFNSTGSCVAGWTYGKIESGSRGSILLGDAGFYVSGSMDSVLTFGTDAFPEPQPGGGLFLAKFDSLSGFTGIQPMPLQEGELHIYANPNKGTCTIDLPTALRLTDDLMLTIVGQTGQVVQRIPLRYTPEGVAIDIRAQAKGIYHVELGDGRQRYTGTIVFE